MSEPTGELQQRIDALEEDMRDAKTIVLQITRREGEIDALANATERLTESTTGLESTLTTVGRAMTTAQEAKRQSQSASDKADQSLAQLARSEHRYRRHTRRMAVLSLVISLIATGTVLLLQRHTAAQLHSFLRTDTGQCVKRQAYDQANHDSIGAAIAYLQSQIDEQNRNRAATNALIRSFPPAQRAALRTSVARGRADLLTYLAAEQTAYAKGVLGSCKSLH